MAPGDVVEWCPIHRGKVRTLLTVELLRMQAASDRTPAIVVSIRRQMAIRRVRIARTISIVLILSALIFELVREILIYAGPTF